MWNKLWKDVEARRVVESPLEIVTSDEVRALPPTVRRYMRFYGVGPGTAKVGSLSLRWTGEFRLGKTRPWMPIEAVQHDTRTHVARIFHMRARMGGVIPILARDIYAHGRGRLVARIADILTMVDAIGPELDASELVTWMNDCVLFAPSMLMWPSTRWTQVDDRSFDVSFTDHDSTVSGRVFVDERGAPVDFETYDRFLEDQDDPKHPLVRGRWHTPVLAHEQIGERIVPSRVEATWTLDSGEFTYGKFQLDTASAVFDRAPAERAKHAA